MLRGCVTGNPILFSRSPQVYKQLFELTGLNGHYSRIASENLRDALNLSYKLKLDFVNITSPFKSECLELNDIEFDYDVTKFNVANSITFSPKTKAFNTDIYALFKIVSSLNLSAESKALVIGAGDTGLMSLKLLENIFDKIDLLSRRTTLKEYLPESQLKNHNEILNHRYDLIINTHSVENFNFDKDFFRNSVIIDAIYHKPWLSKYESKHYISGLRWLELQAIKTFSNVTGSSDKLYLDFSSLPSKQNLIFLIGFMGAGKTTIGRHLASDFGYKFCDLDDLIYNRTGLSIREIFRLEGEHKFREIETKILNECINLSNYVIATGGGIITQKENMNVLKQGIVIWLHESFENLIQRISQNDRPLLDTNSENLYNERQNKYFTASDLIIQNNDMNKTLKQLKYEISSAI